MAIISNSCIHVFLTMLEYFLDLGNKKYLFPQVALSIFLSDIRQIATIFIYSPVLEIGTFYFYH